MFKRAIPTWLFLGAFSLLTACGGSPYIPAASQTQPVDLDAFTPKVDTFVVLLDTSGSMDNDGAEGSNFRTAQNLVASLNDAIPAIDFNSGLVVFGKGAGSCTGFGVAKKIYGITTYNSADFLKALSSIDCVASTTPIGDALDLTAGRLAENTGKIAVFVVSDFKWDDADAVRDAVATLKEQHDGNLCLYAIKVGDHKGSEGLISDITSETGCGGVVSAADLASGEAMTAYAAETLMSPIVAEVMEYEQRTLSSTTLFAFDSATLSADGKVSLREIAGYIKGSSAKVGDIKVIGYTCSLGSDSYNLGLSQRRARAVAEFLAGEGIPAGLMQVSGMGEANPVAGNDTEAGRKQNRRVEIHVGTVRPSGS